MTNPLDTTSPAPVDHVETEWQFEAPDIKRVEGWLQDHPAVGVGGIGRARVQRQFDRYYDTEEGSFFLAGYALRLRAERDTSEATLKSLSAARDGLAQRREITQAIGEAAPDSLYRSDGPVSERVKLLTTPGDLRTLTEIRTIRLVLDVALPGGARGELLLDRSTLPKNGTSNGQHLTRVEVEVPPDSLDAFREFVERLRRECGLEPATESKFEWALRLAGTRPGRIPDLGAADVEQGQTVGATATAILRLQFARYLQHEPGTVLGDDPEHLHDMRVAVRRMRAALRLFGGVFAPEEAASLRGRLEMIGAALGKVRDPDVQVEQIDRWREQVVTVSPAALDPVLDRLREDRRVAREELLALLRSESYRGWRQSLIERLRAGFVLVQPQAMLPTVIVGAGLLRAARRKAMRAGGRLEPSSPPADYHRVRILAKRFRYALESLEEVYGPAVRRMIEPLVRLQDILGLHQDCHVGMSFLRSLVGPGQPELPPATLIGIGELVQLSTARAEALRAECPRALERLRGGRWRRLKLHVLERSQERGAEMVQGLPPKSIPQS